jgi:dynein heavy chain
MYTLLVVLWCAHGAQVEELVAGSNGGRAPALAGYYSYWEMVIFNSLVLMVVHALERLHGLLTGAARRPLFKARSRAGHAPHLCLCSFDTLLACRCLATPRPQHTNTPHNMQLKTSLQSGEVVLTPPLKEVSKLLSAYVKNLVESARDFVRWMDGTCIEVPDQRPKGDADGEPLVMHFGSEVLRMQQVCTVSVIACSCVHALHVLMCTLEFTLSLPVGQCPIHATGDDSRSARATRYPQAWEPAKPPH